jgi:hypothetical protein
MSGKAASLLRTRVPDMSPKRTACPTGAPTASRQWVVGTDLPGRKRARAGAIPPPGQATRQLDRALDERQDQGDEEFHE